MSRLFPSFLASGILLLLAPMGFAQEPIPALEPPPGVVVATSPEPEVEYLGSPGIVILPDGTYVASHDYFGKKGDLRGSTRILSSKDRGATWTPLALVPKQFWSTLFFHEGSLYLLGTSGALGDLIIRRSADGGKNWSTPLDDKTGLLFRGQFHGAPVPVVVHDGRIWRAFEEVVNLLGWPKHFGALVISAPAEADLLNAASWTRTNSVPFDSTLINGRRTGWLEGNVVVTPEGGIANILRTNTKIGSKGPFELHGGAKGIPRFEVAARAEVSADGQTLTFDPAKGFLHFPGSQSKFTIRYDPVSKLYWSLVNKITVQHEDRDSVRSPLSQRNVVMLVSSPDLRHWEERSKVLRVLEGETLTRKGRFGFQYLDWQFDGDDIVALSRTGWGAVNYHNANYITFHRLKNFRSLTMADSAPNLTPRLPEKPAAEGADEGE